MNHKLNIWRQKDANDKGKFYTYEVTGVSPDQSFLEMIDELNDDLTRKGEDPIHFDHDCREGICGACSMVINGHAHGPKGLITTCQLHMRSFSDGEEITVEPWRAKPFPVIKDLVVDRTPLDRIVQAGGYVSVNTGGTPDANEIPIPKHIADTAMDAAQCIGCGACVATCKNASAMLFTAAKISQLAVLPQGNAERANRVENMIAVMEDEGFGGCTNTGACEVECPKGISLEHIARAHREYMSAKFSSTNI